ncbi:hypothetical protein JSY36_06860 [Bacillus sp. H-16]|uniref:hypothetical protein n=1 Tax=Alteribacter salitolerans TaxID=2912333 RepID=UPI00196337B0|nr:hypothetical protein [Alteribacter salitolerans]MBM7095466.1 hypothetical protein [Alteribacter salitolerans]
MDTIIHYQWELFIATEVIAVLSVAAFVVFRYVAGSPRYARISLYVFVAANLFDVVVAFLVYRHTGELSMFQVVIFIFVMYAITFGRSDFKKLDFWLRTQIDRFARTDLVTSEEREAYEEKRYGKAQVHRTLKEWAMHGGLFVTVQAVFFLVFPSSSVTVAETLTQEGISRWMDAPESYGLFSEAAINQVALVWGIILIVDTVITLSYVVFPEKSK